MRFQKLTLLYYDKSTLAGDTCYKIQAVIRLYFSKFILNY